MPIAVKIENGISITFIYSFIINFANKTGTFTSVLYLSLPIRKAPDTQKQTNKYEYLTLQYCPVSAASSDGQIA